jgi:hypothetical protein
MRFITKFLQLNEGTAWKNKKDAQDYCDTMKKVYDIDCKPKPINDGSGTFNIDYENITESENEKTIASKVSDATIEVIKDNISESIKYSVDDIAGSIVGEKTKKMLANDLRKVLSDNTDISYDIAKDSVEDYITHIISNLDTKMKELISDSFIENINKEVANNLDELVNDAIVDNLKFNNTEIPDDGEFAD